MVIIVALALIGFALSLYAFLIERWMKKDPTYKPACDLSDRISCSKPILSKYGKLFGISNTLLGMIYYAAVAVLALLGYYYLVQTLTIAGALASLGFAYILYFKIRSFCLICTATYAINIALLIASF